MTDRIGDLPDRIAEARERMAPKPRPRTATIAVNSLSPKVRESLTAALVLSVKEACDALSTAAENGRYKSARAHLDSIPRLLVDLAALNPEIQPSSE